MERQFGFPIALAAALHAGVLFIHPDKPPTKPVPKPVETIVVTQFPRIPEDEPEIVKADRDDEPQATKKMVAPPSGEEVLVPRPPDVITTFVPERHKVEIDPTAKDLPSGPAGVADRPGSPWGKVEIISSSALDSVPRARVQTAPIYPHEARRFGRDAEVNVEFEVDEQGRVLNPRIVRSDDPMFNEATLRAVSKWRFEPGRRHGKIVRFRMAVPIKFTLTSTE